LRDAQPLPREFAAASATETKAEADQRKREVRKRDLATSELFRIYDDALVDRKPVDLLSLQIQRFCQSIEANEPERAAAARAHRDGRPEDLDARLKIAVDVAEKIEALGSVEAAIQSVATALQGESDRDRNESVKKNYYTGNGDPDWRRWVKVSLAMRRSRAKALSESGGRPPDHDQPKK
jgi:hypothetical protein